MVPNPNKNRYLSGHDDGFHFSNCRGQISVSHCEFAALMDDPINIHGTSVRVEEILSENKVRCRFIHHQGVGLLVSTPGKVVIEGNHFESSGSAILIAGDANNWYDSGAVKDVLIRNNVFAAPCLTSLYQFSEAVIGIYPEIPDPEASEAKFHRNIEIGGNSIDREVLGKSILLENTATRDLHLGIDQDLELIRAEGH